MTNKRKILVALFALIPFFTQAVVAEDLQDVKQSGTDSPPPIPPNDKPPTWSLTADISPNENVDENMKSGDSMVQQYTWPPNWTPPTWPPIPTGPYAWPTLPPNWTPPTWPPIPDKPYTWPTLPPNWTPPTWPPIPKGPYTWPTLPPNWTPPTWPPNWTPPTWPPNWTPPTWPAPRPQ